MIQKNNLVRKVSITYQDLASKRERMEKLAKDMGYTRMKGEEVVPELSPILGLATEFVIANESMFREWIAKGKPSGNGTEKADQKQAKKN